MAKEQAAFSTPKENERVYLCIDLKSFYASVECVDRGLDPLTTNLVVADPERTDKTICLAVSPSLKKLGVRNRCRVFEIPPNLNYVMAPPRMQRYLDVSANVYAVYLQYVAREDIHVYSIDECFLDVTAYLSLYGMTAKELTVTIMEDVKRQTGVRATCGIGSNLYLAKVALDITAKNAPDFIGCLDEETYRQTLWTHQPLTDFWRVGRGIASRLARYGIVTMEGIAKADPEWLYRLFGIDAELLYDHAWGIETVTLADIKAYRSRTNGLSNGQVLPHDYSFDEGLLVAKEMMDALCLEMVEKKLVTHSVTLWIGYSRESGEESVHGTSSILSPSNADQIWLPQIAALYRRIVRKGALIRRLSLGCNDVQTEAALQPSFFDDEKTLERSRKLQQTMNGIKQRFGKNAVLRGMDYESGATAMERNQQIGGHRRGDDGLG